MAAVEEGVKNMNIDEKSAQKQQGNSKKEKKKKVKNKDDGGTSGFPVEVKSLACTFFTPSILPLFLPPHNTHVKNKVHIITNSQLSVNSNRLLTVLVNWLALLHFHNPTPGPKGGYEAKALTN